jgi:hypothetical protein
MVQRITPRDPKTIHSDLRSAATANLSIQSAMEVVSVPLSWFIAPWMMMRFMRAPII